MSRVTDRLRCPYHRANLRAWATYRRACGNELVVDAALMPSLGLSDLLPDVVPRPIPITRKWSRWKPLWAAVLRLISALWTWVLFPVLLIGQMIRTARQWRSTAPAVAPMRDDVAVGFTARIAEVVRCVPEDRRPRQWLTVPWQSVSLTADDGPVGSLLSYVHRRDFWTTAWRAWRAVMIVRRKGLGRFPGGRCRTAILQTYSAWPWFLTWQVLPRAISPTSGVWFANHYDRWTVLLDRLPAGGSRHLVQHGFARGDLRLAHRQARVTEVLYFDHGTRQILENVAIRLQCQPEWTAIRAQLTLTPLAKVLPSTSKPVVLVIGQPVEPDRERELLTALVAGLSDVVVLYKAHPLYGRDGAAHVPSPPVQVLWDRGVFPAADVVLSSGSWLGVEYESTGTPVVWYKSESLAAVVQTVREQLNQARPHARAA
jgi:hypothetical protein